MIRELEKKLGDFSNYCREEEIEKAYQKAKEAIEKFETVLNKKMLDTVDGQGFKGSGKHDTYESSIDGGYGGSSTHKTYTSSMDGCYRSSGKQETYSLAMEGGYSGSGKQETSRFVTDEGYSGSGKQETSSLATDGGYSGSDKPRSTREEMSYGGTVARKNLQSRNLLRQLNYGKG